MSRFLPFSFRWKAAFAAGLFLGLIALNWLRVDYYEWMGYTPEMHPGIAYLFTPIIFLFVAIPTIVVELTLRKIWFAPINWQGSALLGATQASLLVWWAFPDHVWIALLANPVVLRVLIFVFVNKQRRSIAPVS